MRLEPWNEERVEGDIDIVGNLFVWESWEGVKKISK